VVIPQSDVLFSETHSREIIVLIEPKTPYRIRPVGFSSSWASETPFGAAAV
jgi:hypothetical protein